MLDLHTVEQDEGAVVLGSAQLPIRPQAARVVRGFVRRTLDACAVDVDVMDTVALLTCELVTNVVQHARRDIYPLIFVELARVGSMLRIEVHDPDPRMPVVHVTDDDSESGRGLRIVEALASRWGTVRMPAGKYVFCELSMDLAVEGGSR